MAWTQRELEFIADVATAEEQILDEQRVVDFDIKEFTIELLVHKLGNDDLYIPDYQRKFIWSETRQSKFVESIILGFPIPYLFCSDMPDGRLEVIDGTQRLNTLRTYVDNKLRLEGLEKLTALNGYKFNDLPTSQQRKFLNRTLRMITLGSKADDNVRFDLFERINSGSVSLNPAEFRKGAYKGKFYDLVLECAQDKKFKELCPIGKSMEKRGEREELVLRFFAYSEQYQEFSHDVSNFLNDYIKLKNLATEDDVDRMRHDFHEMIEFIGDHFPYGFRKTKTYKTTPRVRFEAIAVGVYLALQKKPDLIPKNMDWLESDEFQLETTTHASNSGPRLRSRVEYVRDALLECAK